MAEKIKMCRLSISAYETIFLRLKSGVCGARDVKLLLPDIFLQEFVPERGVHACRWAGSLNLLPHYSTLLGQGNKSLILHTALRTSSHYSCLR